jgi:hypothetical protein
MSNITQSSDHAVLVFSKNIPSPPDGAKFRSRDEEQIWKMLMESRPYDKWRKIDLITALRYVRLEYELRLIEDRIQNEGFEFVIEGARGQLIKNPLFMMRENLIRQQISVGHVLSISVGIVDVIREANARAMKDRDLTDGRDHAHSHPLLASRNDAIN